MQRVAFILMLLLGVVFAAFEINGDGSPADLTKIGVSARFWGMGKTGVALADDSGAMLLNPASMGMARSFEMSGMSTQVLGMTNYTLVNGVIPYGDHEQSFGFSYINENAGTIYATEGLDQYGHPVKGDTIENSNSVLSLGFASRVDIPDIVENLYLGLLLKGYHTRLDIMTASSMALDLGAVYKWSDNIAFGAAVRNAMQNGLNYSTVSGVSQEHYDTDYVFGAALALFNNDLTLSLDQYTNPKFGRTYLGLEYWLVNTVALRTGLAENDLTLGVGLRYDLLQVDVAYRYQDAPLDNQVFFSVTLGNARRMFLSRPRIEVLEDNNNSANPSVGRPADVPEEVRI